MSSQSKQVKLSNLVLLLMFTQYFQCNFYNKSMNRIVLTEKQRPVKWQDEYLDTSTPNRTLQNQPKITSKSKGKSNTSIQNKPKNKGTPGKKAREGSKSLKKHMSPQHLILKRDKTETLSQDKTKQKQFVRKNNNIKDTKRSTSKKTSKKSTGDENEESLVEHLKAENNFYRKAYLESKQSLEKLEQALQEEKQRRSSEKNWFKHQIDTLKRKLSADKIKLGHIFTFESFKQEDISNMIVQVQNESSSMMPNTVIMPQQQEVNDPLNLSDLSIESK